MMFLTREQVREVDRRSIEQFHIPGIVLMENAARAVTQVALEMLGKQSGNVLIVCGGGNNGGDGLAVARHLHNRGILVQIALTVNPWTYHGDALINWNITQAMRIPTTAFSGETLSLNKPDLIIDAIFGTGLSRPPRDPFAEIANAINSSGAPILAVDVPSGLDCDQGVPLGACVRASRTVTFVAQKAGFARNEAKEYLGTVTVGPIECPVELVPGIAPA